MGLEMQSLPFLQEQPVEYEGEDTDDDVPPPPCGLQAMSTFDPFEPNLCCLSGLGTDGGLGTAIPSDSGSLVWQPVVWQPVFSCAAVALQVTCNGHHLSAPSTQPCPQTPGEYVISGAVDAFPDTTVMPHRGCGCATDATSRTTVMARNLPGNYTHDHLEAYVLNKLGFKGRYNALYYPKDMKRGNAGSGFAFVNFVSPEDAQEFRNKFEKFDDWTGRDCKKVATTDWAEQQGLNRFIERYRNSPVMHSTVAADCKPRLYKDGDRIAFPAPTKKIRPPSVDKEQLSNQRRYEQVSVMQEEGFRKQCKLHSRNGKTWKSKEKRGC